MILNTSIQDSYYKEYKPNDPMTNIGRYEYMRIISGFIQFIIKKVLEGFDVRLSGGRSLGTLCIRGKKLTPIIQKDGTVKGLPTDWSATWKLWRENPEAKLKNHRIYHLNEHSNGIKYTICWWKTGMRIANKHLYMLKRTVGPKSMGRKLAKVIKEENREYIITHKKEYYGRNQESSSETPN